MHNTFKIFKADPEIEIMFFSLFNVFASHNLAAYVERWKCWWKLPTCLLEVPNQKFTFFGPFI